MSWDGENVWFNGISVEGYRGLNFTPSNQHLMHITLEHRAKIRYDIFTSELYLAVL